MIESLTVADLKIESSIQIAEEFGKYFSQIGKTFAYKIENPKTNTIEYIKKIDLNKQSIYLYLLVSYFKLQDH